MGGFVRESSSDSYVLLGGGGHKLESSLSVAYAASTASATYATSAGNADTVDGYHASAFALSSHDHDSRYIRTYSYYWSGAGNFYTDVDIRAYDGGGVIMIYGGWNLAAGDGTKSYVIAVWCSYNSITQPKYKFLFDDGYLAGQGIDAIYVDGNGKLVIHTTMAGNYCAFIQKFDW